MVSAPNPFSDVPTGEGRDQQLVQLAKGGSRAALEELVVRHQSWIYNLALRMVHHPADAADATQACHRFRRRLPKLTPSAPRTQLG